MIADVLASGNEEGMIWIESPVYNEVWDNVIFSDVKGEDENGITSGHIYETTEFGAQVLLKESGLVGPPTDFDIEGFIEAGSNGIIMDGENMIFCQHGAKRIVSINRNDIVHGMVADEDVTIIADTFEGNPLNSPNDLKKLGDHIYFTDPPFGLQKAGDSGLEDAFARQTQPSRNIFQYNMETGELKALIRMTEQAPNGIGVTSLG
eukprot:UN24000